jgi:hypothetical protein
MSRKHPNTPRIFRPPSLLDDIYRRLTRTSQGPPLEYLYRANHIHRTFAVDFETFCKAPGRYLFALPPYLQELWQRNHTLLPEQQRISDRYASAACPLAENSPGATLLP